MTATITGTLYKPNNEPWVSATVRWDLMTVLSSTDGVHPPATVYVQTNSFGRLLVELATPPVGFAKYRVVLPDGKGYVLPIKSGEHSLQALFATEYPAVAQTPVEAALRFHSLDPTAHPELRALLLAAQNRSDAHYEQVFLEPSKLWVCVHNLGKFPAVETMLLDGTVIYGREQQVSKNETHIHWGTPLAGRATFN